MAEYIDRETLCRQLLLLAERYNALGNVRVAQDYNWAVTVLGGAPAEDVAPVVHGRWDGEGDGLADGEIVLDVWYCSECGHCIDDGTDDPCVLPNYCPNCGAKMDGGDSDGR